MGIDFEHVNFPEDYFQFMEINVSLQPELKCSFS